MAGAGRRSFTPKLCQEKREEKKNQKLSATSSAIHFQEKKDYSAVAQLLSRRTEYDRRRRRTTDCTSQSDVDQ